MFLDMATAVPIMIVGGLFFAIAVVVVVAVILIVHAVRKNKKPDNEASDKG